LHRETWLVSFVSRRKTRPLGRHAFVTEAAQTRAFPLATVGHVNSVRLAGSIATDVTLRHYDERRRVSFLLRVERAEGRGVDFVPVVAWNAIADGCERLGKGDRAAVAGEIRSRRWQDDEGRRHRAVEVVATSVARAPSPEEVTAAS
jgi:single-strand DNA-binding protein